MADQTQLELLQSGPETWNKWREKNPEIQINLSGAVLRGANLNAADFNKAILFWANLFGADLSGADLSGANLNGANLSGANLSGTDLSGARLFWADLSGADLSETDLAEADLSGANLSGTDLSGARLLRADLSGADLSQADLGGADLRRADLSEADLSQADLSGADLRRAILSQTTKIEKNWKLVWEIVNEGASKRDLSETDLAGAILSGADLSGANLRRATMTDTDLREVNLTGCSIYGISAWKLNIEGAIQSDLVISDENEPVITVDNIEVAQFIYLLLNYKKLRDALNVVTNRGMLILGRFKDGGLEFLQAIAAELRELKYLPIIFEFDRLDNRSDTETMEILAKLSRFVIADLSGVSVPWEAGVAGLNIPFVPIIKKGREKYSMYRDLPDKWPRALPLIEFENQEQLLKLLPSKIIGPAEEKHQERQIELKKRYNDE